MVSNDVLENFSLRILNFTFHSQFLYKVLGVKVSYLGTKVKNAHPRVDGWEISKPNLIVLPSPTV